MSPSVKSENPKSIAVNEMDDLAHLAAKLCAAPIACIVFIDEDKLKLKAKYGIDEFHFERLVSIFGPAMQSAAEVTILDTFELGQTIRFYAGVPLVSSEGFLLGSICVMDHFSRQLDFAQTHLLQSLATQAVAVLERNRFREEKLGLSERLQEASKLASFGRLASSIIHEINNPLAILHARAALLGNLAKDGKITTEKALEFSEKMLETTRRMSKIVNAFASAMGNGEQEPAQNISLQSLIEETLSFVIGRFNNGHVQFKYEPPEDPIYLICKGTQISQVLVNLLNNAYDAVCDQKSKQKWVKLEILDADDHVAIKVRDGGSISTKADPQKVFAPFFTTKEVGKGTGLGLAISADIVKAHGGELSLESGARNTTFMVKLPKKRMIHFNHPS